MELYVITFPSVYHAFRAKKVLKEQGIEVELIPVPRELSESCDGLAARIASASVERAVTVLGDKGIVMLQKGVKVEAGK